MRLGKSLGPCYGRFCCYSLPSHVRYELLPVSVVMTLEVSWSSVTSDKEGASTYPRSTDMDEACLSGLSHYPLGWWDNHHPCIW